MTSAIAGDGLPNGSIVRANGPHNVAATELGCAVPVSGPQQEGGDASTANNLLGVPPEATAAHKGRKSSSSAEAGAAGGNHANNHTQDPAAGLESAIAADQHVSAAEATSEGQNTREGSPSYPIAIQPAQDIELQKPSDRAARRVHANGLISSDSPPESLMTAGTEAAGAVSDGPNQVEVDMKPPPAPKKEPPAFVQTSSLISNSCGYCGTRSTSGCWRRGWDLGNGKSINLCNKCGLRHKAGKLQSVPQPTPSPVRRSATATAAGRFVSKKHAAAAAASLTSAEREAAAASAAAAVAAAAGLPGSTANELLRSITFEQQQQWQAGGGSSLSSLLTVAAANAGAVPAGDDDGSSDQNVDPQVLETKTKIMAFLDGLGFGTDHNMNGSSLDGSVPRRVSSNVLPYSDYAAADDLAAAAAAGSNRSSLSGEFRSQMIPGMPDITAAAAAAAAGNSEGFDLRSLSNMSPEFMQHLTGVTTEEEPPRKRRRTKKIPGALPVAAPAAAAGSGRSRSAAAAGMDTEDSLAVGAASALLTLNRSSPSGSPQTGSPPTLPNTAAAATADPFSPPITYDQAAAAAAADKAAAAAERAAAAAATAVVDAAAGIAGWSSGPMSKNKLEAFLTGAFNPRPRVNGAAAAAAAVPTGAAAALGGGHLGGSSKGSGDYGAQLPSIKPQATRQVTTSPNALRPGTHSLFPASNSPSSNPSPRNNVTSPSNLTTPANNLVGNPASATARSWPQERIYQWLHSTGCNEAVRVFKDLDLDGLALAGLVRVAGADPARLHEVLKVDLGVQHVGLRLRLVENLVCLAMGEGS